MEETKQLLKFTENLSLNRVESYLLYSFLAEYITVLVGPKILKHLKKSYHIVPQKVSIINNHIELDKHHVKEDIDAIKTFLSPEKENLKQIEKDLKICSSYMLKKFALATM